MKSIQEMIEHEELYLLAQKKMEEELHWEQEATQLGLFQMEEGMTAS